MDRVSYRQLENLTEVTNRMLERRGSRARLELGRRNGYCALDLTTAEDIARGHGGIDKTLQIGTTGELARYLHAMREALWLITGPYSSTDST